MISKEMARDLLSYRCPVSFAYTYTIRDMVTYLNEHPL